MFAELLPARAAPGACRPLPATSRMSALLLTIPPAGRGRMWSWKPTWGPTTGRRERTRLRRRALAGAGLGSPLP